MPNDFRKLTHSTEKGFILKSPYKPKALPAQSQQAEWIKVIRRIVDENMFTSTFTRLFCTPMIIRNKKSKSVKIFARISKVDSLSIMSVFC